MKSHLRLCFLGAFTLASAIDIPPRTPAPTGTGTWAPLIGMDDEVIDSKYVVMFHPGHTLEQHFVNIGHNLSHLPGFEYATWLPGYTALFHDEEMLDLVRPDPQVLLVEPDKPVRLIEPVQSFESSNASVSDDHQKREYTLETNYAAPYGLQQVGAGSKLKTPVNNGGRYDHIHPAGTGTQNYILDTGIRISHSAFGGRARHFPDFLKPGDNSPYVDEPPDDTNGHGTHVAGIAAGKQYGVAPYADIWNVKVLGKGATSYRIGSAVSDVAADHNKKKRGAKGFKWRGSVINMSLTGPPQASLQQALIYAREAGISVFAAAGNENKNVRNPWVFPCAYPQVDCIGAVDQNYRKADFSNYGAPIAYVAPGKDILSCGIKSDDDWAYKSGTSQATPHVTGAAAIFSSWHGLASNLVYATRYVWWNTLADITTGWIDGTANLFVTTGIHSPKKYPKEPFRWAGDYPAANPRLQSTSCSFTGEDVSATPTALPSSELTVIQQSMSSTTDSPLPPGTTEPGRPTETIPEIGSLNTAGFIPSTTSLHFTYDPLPTSTNA